MDTDGTAAATAMANIDRGKPIEGCRRRQAV